VVRNNFARSVVYHAASSDRYSWCKSGSVSAQSGRPHRWRAETAFLLVVTPCAPQKFWYRLRTQESDSNSNQPSGYAAGLQAYRPQRLVDAFGIDAVAIMDDESLLLVEHGQTLNGLPLCIDLRSSDSHGLAVGVYRDVSA
jgi:hypothetical protein